VRSVRVSPRGCAFLDPYRLFRLLFKIVLEWLLIHLHAPAPLSIAPLMFRSLSSKLIPVLLLGSIAPLLLGSWLLWKSRVSN
jgi:hypothetical protein